MDCIVVALDRVRLWELLNAVMNFGVLYSVVNFLTGLETVSFSSNTVLHAVSK